MSSQWADLAEHVRGLSTSKTLLSDIETLIKMAEQSPTLWPELAQGIESALESRTDVDSTARAQLLCWLGDAYRQTPSGNSASLYKALSAYQDGLTLITAEDQRTLVAQIKNRIGIVLSQLPDERFSTNLQAALASFKEALRTYPRIHKV